MGGRNSKEEIDINVEDFEEVPEQEIHEASDNEYMVVRNRINGILYDRYRLHFINEQDYKFYLESVKFRQNEPNIVRANYIVPQHRKEFCSVAYSADVYLEHCRARLSDYKDIPYPDNLYCMMAMLNGYESLYEKVGGFSVSQRQVLIDEHGEIRVWINSDFSKNHPEQFDQNPIQAMHKNWQEGQFDMADDVIKIVIQNTDENDGPGLKFSNFYQRQKATYNNKVGFEEARSIIHEYAHHNNIKIPDVFESVLEIYRQGQKTGSQGHIVANGRPMSHEVDYFRNQNQLVRSNSNPQLKFLQAGSARDQGHIQTGERRFFQQNMIHSQPRIQKNLIAMDRYPLKPQSRSLQPHPIINRTDSYKKNQFQPMLGHNFPHPHPHSQPILRKNIYETSNNRPMQTFFRPTNAVISIPPPNRNMFPQPINRTLPPHIHQYPQRPMYPNPQMIQQPQYIKNQNHVISVPQQPQILSNVREQVKNEQEKQAKDIEDNIIMKASENLYGVSEQNVIRELNQYHREENSAEEDLQIDSKNQFYQQDRPQVDHYGNPQNTNYGQQKEREQTQIQYQSSHNYGQQQAIQRTSQQNLAQRFAQQRQFLSSGSSAGTPFRQFGLPMNYSNNSYQGIKSGNMGYRQAVRKQFYFTINNQVELDPEIAADLAMYLDGPILA